MRLEHHLAVPDGDGPHPGVVVLHELIGLNDDIRRIADRFAANGYAALAPDIWSGGNRVACLTRGLTSRGWVLDRVEESRRFLASQPGVDDARIGVVGFCWGGGFALLFGRAPGVRAAAVNYGAVPRTAAALDGVCPVVGSYGRLDKVFGEKHGVRLERHLTALGVAHDVKVYDGVGHSFVNIGSAPSWMAKLPDPMHVAHDADAAEDTWDRMLSWFGRHVRDAEVQA